MTGQFQKKNTLQKKIFTSILTTARDMTKPKVKNTGNMCQLVDRSEDIPITTETMMQKSSIYLLGMSNRIFNFISKTSQYPFLHLLFFKKRHDFERLIFAFKKFQKMRTKSLFLGFRNSFSACYFPISQEPLDQNSSLTPLWNNN